jgi:predicted DNA-binding transcriptional regulator YafY
MSRSERLLELIQTLRRYRRPVSGQTLADETNVSLRTLYRDIATLQAQGADIEGEPGMGYILKPGFLLPPLMFSEDEIEALVLGSRWVASRTDSDLSRAASNVLAKIAAVLPDDLKPKLESSNLLVPPSFSDIKDAVDLSLVRKAIRNEHIVEIGYVDAAGVETERKIWPFALGFYDRVRVIAAWCEMRGDFRNFRTDRIQRMEPQGKRYPRRKAELLKAWRIADGRDTSSNADNI